MLHIGYAKGIPYGTNKKLSYRFLVVPVIV